MFPVRNGSIVQVLRPIHSRCQYAPLRSRFQLRTRAPSPPALWLPANSFGCYRPRRCRVHWGILLRHPLKVWRDPSGHVSALRIVALICLFAPLSKAIYDSDAIKLDARPITELIHRTGDWALIFLLVALAVRPLSRILRFNQLLDMRRMIGVPTYPVRGFYIAANRLVPVLEAFNPGDIDELHAVYLGQGGLLPLRIRVFLEFLAERIKIADDWPAKNS